MISVGNTPTIQASLLTSFHRNENCSYPPHSPASEEPRRPRNCRQDWYRKNNITQMLHVLYVCLSWGKCRSKYLCMYTYMIYIYTHSIKIVYIYIISTWQQPYWKRSQIPGQTSYSICRKLAPLHVPGILEEGHHEICESQHPQGHQAPSSKGLNPGPIPLALNTTGWSQV